MFLICAAVFAAWRSLGRRRDEGAASAADAPAGAVDERPTAREWCESIESLTGCGALCLDEALCLVAAGQRGLILVSRSAVAGEERRDSPRLHLMDLAPPDAQSQMLKLSAAARRGPVSGQRVSWRGEPADVAASSVGRWIAICVSFSRCALCALLICAMSMSCGRPRAEEIAQPQSRGAESEPGVRLELARWLESEGYKSVRARRFKQAADAALLIRFLAGPDAAALLDARIRDANARQDLLLSRIKTDDQAHAGGRR